jgi:cyclopropane fatty-acyl-phospholipid synthase-like methyltransferase
LVRQFLLGITARSSGDYWERRYRAGLTSGCGSAGELAAFKAEILNEFVRTHEISSVIEFGCGDGSQLGLAHYPRYLGLDVSKAAIDHCARRFAEDASKSFLWYDPAHAINLAGFLSADLTLSLDVIYHLLEDRVYSRYLRDLFSTARRFVIIYSSDREERLTALHVRHRKFTLDVERDCPNFRLLRRIGNRHREKSFADFFIYERVG